MTQHPTRLSRAAVLLLTAAALPLTPLAAQEAQPETQAEPEAQAQPTPEPNPAELPDPAVADPVQAAPVEPAENAPATARPPKETPSARSDRNAPPPRDARAGRVDRLRRTAAQHTGDVAPPPRRGSRDDDRASADPPQRLRGQEQSGGSILPWLIAGLLALGAAAFLLLRRRRTAEVHEDAPAFAEPVAVAAAAPIETGRPALDLDIRPRRAGVSGDDAVVEFELAVGNHGDATARDVRVSTWLLPSGARRPNEAERALIEGGGGGQPLADVAAGSAERIESAVALPTSSVEGDAVLPVVVAEAHYTLPDGRRAYDRLLAVASPMAMSPGPLAMTPVRLHEDVVAQRSRDWTACYRRPGRHRRRAVPRRRSGA